MVRAVPMLSIAKQHRLTDVSSLCGTNCCALGTCVWIFYALISMQQLIGNELIVPRVRRTATDVSHMRLPNFYLCPADRERVDPVRWRSFDCKVTFKGEKAECDASLDAYKGKVPNDLDGRRHGSGACVEFSTHDIMVMSEWSAAWNEVTLRATFDPKSMFFNDQNNVLQEVELGYRAHELEMGQGMDRFYYPLLRVPVFYVGPTLVSAGIATRAFLGKEVDRLPDVTGRYWYVYGGMQVPMLNASLPKKTFMNDRLAAKPVADPEDVTSGFVHIVLTIEDFETYGFQTVPFVVPLFKTLGEIAGVGALMAWATYRFRGAYGSIGQKKERISSRLVAYMETERDLEESELDTARKDYTRSAEPFDPDEAYPEKRNLLERDVE